MTMQALRYRALFLQRTIGTRCAAGFLRNRNFSMEGAIALLARVNHGTV